MDQINFWQAATVSAFFSCLVCAYLTASWGWWCGVLGVVFFLVFIGAAGKLELIVSENLDDLGCVYFGSEERNHLYVPPKKVL